MGQAFQFTPDGIEEIRPDNDRTQPFGAVNPAAPPIKRAPVEQPQPVAQQTLPTFATTQAPAPAAKQPAQQLTITGNRQLIRAAKARLKELKAELKRLKAVEREKAELERLLKAARQKPASTVRALRSA